MDAQLQFEEIAVPDTPATTLQNAWRAAERHGLALAAWRSPDESDPSWMIGRFETVPPDAIRPPAFVRGLFHNMVPAEALIPTASHLGNKLYRSLPAAPPEPDELLAESLHVKHEKAVPEALNDKDSKINYINACQKALSYIKDKQIEKIVLARDKQVALSEAFFPPAFFEVLCAQYPGAFISLTWDPSENSTCGGAWIGASPEILLDVNETELYTLAMAGTSSGNSNGFTDKEKYEQALVTRYIKEVLQKAGASFDTGKPSVQAAGHLNHISTSFTIRNHGNWHKLLTALHPTPAVCGYPDEQALKLIKELESINRGYYAGFLGPVLDDNYASFYVNLRCIQVVKQTGYLYAGAGIVEGSDPEKEWEETEQKTETILNLL